MKNRYQKSNCKGGYLCKYKILYQLNGGLVERCERCGKKMFFPADTPNHIFLQYHIREALNKNDPAFNHEYPQYA